jgi:hypothetical protein
MPNSSVLKLASSYLGLCLILPILCPAQAPSAGDLRSEIRYAAFAESIAAGDFDNNGRLDFVASSSHNAIVVLLGNGRNLSDTYSVPRQLSS